MCSTAQLGKGKQHHSTSPGLFGTGEGRAGQKSLSKEGWMWVKFRQCQLGAKGRDSQNMHTQEGQVHTEMWCKLLWTDKD